MILLQRREEKKWRKAAKLRMASNVPPRGKLHSWNCILFYLNCPLRIVISTKLRWYDKPCAKLVVNVFSSRWSSIAMPLLISRKHYSKTTNKINRGWNIFQAKICSRFFPLIPWMSRRSLLQQHPNLKIVKPLKAESNARNLNKENIVSVIFVIILYLKRLRFIAQLA